MSIKTAKSTTDNFIDVDLHELAKGWKAAVSRATDPATRHEARIKNDRGNLPIHSACSFRAPIEVTEALLETFPEGASITNNYGNLSLHFTAWKKGPLDVIKLLLKVYPEGATQKNNHGNLPLHYAAHYNAPLEVVEALYNAYPEGAHQKNNDSNTPLDLAVADGASPNVVALLQGKPVPPSEEEMLDSAKARCERMEKELQRAMEGQDGAQSELETVLSFLLEVKQGHSHALYSAGIDASKVTDMESLLFQVRKMGEESRSVGPTDGGGITDDGSLLRSMSLSPNSVSSHTSANNTITDDEEEELQAIEDALVPPDDEVEKMLSKIVGLEPVKNQIRGIRRTIELEKIAFASNVKGAASGLGVNAPYRQLPRHIALIGNPGSGKTHVGKLLLNLLFKIGAVPSATAMEVGRDELVDRKSEKRTIAKTRAVLEKATGGVLLVDEAYTMLPCPARPRGRDYGPVALRELAKSIASGGNGPLILLVGYSAELHKVLASEVGFRGNFLTKIEFPDPSVSDIARMFFVKVLQKGLLPADGLTVAYVSQLLEQNTQEDWKAERNGRVADLLLTAVRNEMKHRSLGGELHSRESVNPKKLLPGSGHRLPVNAADEIVITLEDVQHAVMNGL